MHRNEPVSGAPFAAFTAANVRAAGREGGSADAAPSQANPRASGRAPGADPGRGHRALGCQPLAFAWAGPAGVAVAGQHAGRVIAAPHKTKAPRPSIPSTPHRATLIRDFAADDWPARIYGAEAPDAEERRALFRAGLILLIAVGVIGAFVALSGGRI